MKVMLSIKPEFANRIFNGSKKYEFRRTIFKNPSIKTVLVYASSPIQRVIGEFEIEKILTDTPAKLWKKTKSKSEMSEEAFFTYFSGKKTGFAIEIKNTHLYEKPQCLLANYNVSPPQSFCYV